MRLRVSLGFFFLLFFALIGRAAGQCPQSALSIPAGASASCPADPVPDGASCTLSRQFYSCTAATCTGTSWSTPACTPVIPCTGGAYLFPDTAYPVEMAGISIASPLGVPRDTSVGCGNRQGAPPLCPHDWSICAAKASGEVCQAGVDWSCNDGWTAVGSFTLSCDGAGMFRTTGASCVPNACSGGPAAGGDLVFGVNATQTLPAGVLVDANAVSFAQCNAKKSGQTCERQRSLTTADGYTCAAGYSPTVDFPLVCDTAGKYLASSAKCELVSCLQGPHTDTIPEHTTAGKLAGCNSKKTGETCSPPEWECDAGYAAQGDIAIVCDITSRYRVAGASCTPIGCQGGPMNVGANVDAASLSGCSALSTGGVCTGYTCTGRFSPGASFALTCTAAGYDASGAVCLPNACTGGPVPSSVPQGATLAGFTRCNALRDGDVCTDIVCSHGHALSGSLTLQCAQGTNMYTVSGVTCQPAGCGAGPISTTIPSGATAGDFSSCTSLATGGTCTYTCKAGFVPGAPLALVCTAAGFSASSASCVPDTGSGSCYRGPFDLPANSLAQGFAPCNGMQSGGTCSAYECLAGHSPGGGFPLVCEDGWYNASAAVCTPNACSAGPSNGANLAGVDHSGCNALATRELCSVANYTCPAGYRPDREFYLSCASDGSYYSLARCVGEVCAQGPGNAPAGMDLSTCSQLRTGEVCRANYIRCPAGQAAQGEFVLMCTAGAGYAVSGVSCGPTPCSDAVHCNGRGTASASQTQPGACECACRSEWEGLTCGSCVSPNPECLVCSSAVHCNNRASAVALVGGACECVCAGKWTGKTCSECPQEFDPIACNSCAAGRVGYPQCGICSSANSCNGRAASAVPSVRQDRCVCEGCSGQWGGDFCGDCPSRYTGVNCDTCAAGHVQYPDCTECTTTRHCSSRGASVSVSADGQQCVCACSGNWGGTDCSVCPVQFDQRTGTCSTCAVGYHGPTCTQCTATAHCSSHATAVTSTAARDACECTCRNGWTGLACSTCPSRFNASLDCGACAEGFYAYPACLACDVTQHCSSNAVRATTNADGTGCDCTCTGQWQGKSCQTCTSEFDVTCSQCAADHVGYPSCVRCTSYAHCNSRAAVTVVANPSQTECVCGTCINKWSGSNCSECLPPFDETLDCKQCVEGHIGYPLCDRCTLDAHCNGHAASVSSSTDRSTCLCTCADGWQGTTCNTCPWQYDPATCSECREGYINYPACTECTAAQCSGHGIVTGTDTNRTECTCTCRSKWAGAACNTCPSPFGGTDCDACSDPTLQYPACLPAGSTAVPATPLPPGATSAPATPSPTLDRCATVVCAARDQCHTAGTCDPITGICSNPPAPDGHECNDGNAQTLDDTCSTGVCSGGLPCGSSSCRVADPQCQEPVCEVVNAAATCTTRLLQHTCDDGLTWTRNDRCTQGRCRGDPIPCTTPPTVLNGVVNCPAQGADGDLCTVTPITGAYACTGAVLCRHEAAPMYTSTAACVQAVPPCRLPSTPAGTAYVGLGCVPGALLQPDSPCSARCTQGYASPQGTTPVTLQCTAGSDVLTLARFIACTPSPCSAAAAPTHTGASVTCPASTPHGALCTVTSLYGYDCSGNVACIHGAYNTTVACIASLCRGAAPPQLGNARAECDGFSCRVIPETGYRCSGAVVCRGGAYSSSVACEQHRCAEGHFAANGTCIPCEAQTARPAGDDPASGDTLCTPTSVWWNVAHISTIAVAPAVVLAGLRYPPRSADLEFAAPCGGLDAAIANGSLTRVFRVDMGTARDYFMIPQDATACSVLKGDTLPLWGTSPTGPWEQLQKLQTGGAAPLGGMSLAGSALRLQHDMRGSVSAWGAEGSSVNAAGCCADSFAGGGGVGWGQPSRMHFMAVGDGGGVGPGQTPAPLGGTEKVFRVMYDVAVSLFSTSAFREAMEEVALSVSRSFALLQVLRVCPESACPGGACPPMRTASLEAGCSLPGMFAESRDADALQSSSTSSYVDFDMLPTRLPSEATLSVEMLKQRLLDSLTDALSNLTSVGGGPPLRSLSTEDRVKDDLPQRNLQDGGSDSDLAWWIPVAAGGGALVLSLCAAAAFLCMRGRGADEEEGGGVQREDKACPQDYPPEAGGSGLYPVPAGAGGAYPGEYLYPRVGAGSPGDVYVHGGYDDVGGSEMTPDTIGPSASQVPPNYSDAGPAAQVRGVHSNPISNVFEMRGSPPPRFPPTINL